MWSYFKSVMKSERGILPFLAPLIGAGASWGLNKLFGGGGGGYPKFNYQQQIPMRPGYWDERYSSAMMRPRREASRFSQAATKNTLPGGPRMMAQTEIGRNLMDTASQTSLGLEKERMAYEVPWQQQQGMWQREDKLRKYLMGQQNMQGIFGLLGQGIGGAANWFMGGGQQQNQWNTQMQDLYKQWMQKQVGG